jgi:hypothetical protein
MLSCIQLRIAAGREFRDAGDVTPVQNYAFPGVARVALGGCLVFNVVSQKKDVSADFCSFL